MRGVRRIGHDPADLEAGKRISVPQFPLGPGRAGFSKRSRLIMAVFMGAVVVIVVAVGAVIAATSSRTPPRAVTIPPADRRAPAALLRAAEAVGFHPNTLAGIGTIENEPANLAAPPASGLLAVGSTAPDFALSTPPGQVVRLRDLRGKAVLLEFFATWCPHCAAEANHLIHMYRTLPHARYAFVSVNADGEDAASVLAYHIYFGFPFPAVLDPSSDPGTFHSPGSRGRVSRAYDVPSYPTFYVLDTRGRVVWRSDGEQPDALLLEELHKAAGA